MDATLFASRIAKCDLRTLKGQLDTMHEVIAEGGPFAAEYAELLPVVEQALANRSGAQVIYRTSDDDLPRDYTQGNGTATTTRRAVSMASDKQLHWITKLAAEKDLSGATTPVMGPIKVPADLTTLSSKAASVLLDRLFAAPKAANATTGTPASEKQLGLIQRLLSEKDTTGINVPELDTLTGGRGGSASTLIDALFAAPKKARQAAAHELAAGAYQVDERIIRVYRGQQSGHMLCAELVDATATTRDEAWKYLGRADRFVAADAHRMTVEECEQASAGTADHGWCCVCGRELDDPKSVARGIGPVCRAKQGGDV